MTEEEYAELLQKHQDDYDDDQLICSRCNKPTGNTNQGHYWAFCKITKTTRNFHFCCPGDCQLEKETQ